MGDPALVIPKFLLYIVFEISVLYGVWQFFRWSKQNAENGHYQRARVCALLMFLAIVAAVGLPLEWMGVFK